jgi:hypothetical protein
MITILSDSVSFLVYPNLFDIKYFVFLFGKIIVAHDTIFSSTKRFKCRIENFKKMLNTVYRS